MASPHPVVHSTEQARADRNRVLHAFDDCWRRGEAPDLADFQNHPHVNRKTLLLGLAILDMKWRQRRGETPTAERYLQRFAELSGDADARRRLARHAAELVARVEDAGKAQPSAAPPAEDLVHTAVPLPPRRRGRRVLALAATVAMLATAGTLVWVYREPLAAPFREESAESEIAALLRQAEADLRNDRLSNVDAALAKADDEVAKPENAAWKQPLAELHADREMIRRLEEIEARRLGLMGNPANPEFARKAYPQAFADFGVALNQPADAAQTIGNARIGHRLLPALDAWLQIDPANQAVRDTLRRADPDADRTAARAAVAGGDGAAIREHARRLKGQTVSPALALLLGGSFLLPDEDAIALLKACQAEHPTHVPLTVLLGHRLLGSAQWEDATRRYKEALNRQSDCPPALGGLCTALCALRRFDEAASILAREAQVHRERAGSYTLLAFVLNGDGQFDTAIDALQKAIRIDPRDVEAHVHLAWMLNRRKRTDESIGVLRTAVELEPQNSRIHLTLATALAEKGDFKAAIPVLDQAIALEPRDAAAPFALGTALWADGRRDEALAAYRQAIALAPKHLPAHVRLGEALFELQRFAEAVPVLQKAVELDGKNDLVRRKLVQAQATAVQAAEPLNALPAPRN